MPRTLHSEVAVVTGGAAGIGLAITRLFLAQGAYVVIVDVQPCQDPELEARSPENFSFLRTDVLHEGDVQALLACPEARFGRRMSCSTTPARPARPSLRSATPKT